MYCYRFLIDFGMENSTNDIALRIACRVSTNTVGRNSRIKNVWGPEETDSAIPFELCAGSSFEIQVLFTIECIYIALDGLHIAKFFHRLPFHNIRAIEIRGDIGCIQVHRNIVTDYPTRPEKTPHIARIHSVSANIDPGFNAMAEYGAQSPDAIPPFLPLPYYATFAKGFFDHCYSINIKGQVRLNPHVFKVSMQVGQNVWPQPTVALMMEFRFSRQKDGETGEPIIARNSFANGKWATEVKSELATGLRPGAEFHMFIIRGQNSFEVYMNDKPVTNYPFSVNPTYVDTCFISGDIKLLEVDIDKD